MTIGPGDSQTAVDARRAAWAITKAARDADKAARQARRDGAKARTDNTQVTWGELRPLLIDAGILDP